MKVFEAIRFGAIAISLHIIAISFLLPETLGSNQNGEDGEQETITLSSISFSTSDLVKAWETSPEIISVVPALLSTPRSLSVNLPFTKGVADPETEIGSLSNLKLLQNDLNVSRPIIPATFANRVYSTVSVDQEVMQNNDNILLDLPDTEDTNPIKENYTISKKNPNLATFKPQIDISSVAPTDQFNKLQAKTELASRPQQSASEEEESQKKQPNPKDKKLQRSSDEINRTRENLYSWGSKIHSAIERKKFYPSGTRSQGRVILNITVHSSGHLVKTEIAQSSGAVLLDNAALTAVKRAQYPVAPEGLIEDKYRFQIPIKMSRD
jgi:protein TonB